MSSEIDRLRRDVLLSDEARRHGVSLQHDGNEFVACCPFHAEHTPSFTIFTGRDGIQRFQCFGCDAAGDVIDFIQGIKGVGKREAIKILGGASAGPNVAPVRTEQRNVYAGITPIEPPDEIRVGEVVRLYNPKRAGHDWEWGKFTPSAVHPYRRADGSLIGYVLRREFKDGGKETPMVMRVRLTDGSECWSRFPFPGPRALYGLDALRDGQVVVVEGEKCRDAFAAASTRNIVSWPGGTHGVHHTDWSPLAGREVFIWPDADEPGVKTAETIAKALHAQGATVRLFAVKPGVGGGIYTVVDWRAGKPSPEGWDVADAVRDGWLRDDLNAFMKATKVDWMPPEGAAVDPEPMPENVVRMKPRAEARQTQQEKPAEVIDIETGEPIEDEGTPWQNRFVLTDAGKWKPNAAKNWGLLLEHHPRMQGVFQYDEFRQRVMLMRCPPWEHEGASWEPRAVTDRDEMEAVMWLEARHMAPKVSGLNGVILTIAHRHRFDRLKEYLNGLVWDGEHRVTRFATDYLGCAGDNYAPIVSERWLISSVARGLKPGCKVDTMPILEGPQGAQKSTAIRRLYGDEFFTDGLSDIGTKDAKMEMQGIWGLEVAEMHKFNQAETNEVKKFLTQQVDRFRPPYGRSLIEAPRRCVLAGTINPEGSGYLNDATGARRFWPTVIGRIDIDAIERDRDQIWAEAVAMFHSGTPWWVQDDEQETVKAEQERRSDPDVWAAALAATLSVRTEISQLEALAALDIPKKDIDRRHVVRLGKTMMRLGWKTVRDRANGEDRVVYRKKGTLPGTEDDDGAW